MFAMQGGTGKGVGTTHRVCGTLGEGELQASPHEVKQMKLESSVGFDVAWRRGRRSRARIAHFSAGAVS